MRRTVVAPPVAVYDEWLDPAALADFLRPNTDTTVTVECDPRIGGRLSIVMSNPRAITRISGEYLELDRPHRLSFSWRSSRGGGFDSVVVVTFEPVGEAQTQMTIEHQLLPPGQADDHRRGWANIARLVARRLSPQS